MAMMMWAMWDLGHLSTSAGEADARSALIIRGAALGLLFTPINNVAFGSLKPQEAQQASGLINLARQLGGSFGIAVLGAYLTRHIAYHRADLATNMYPGNPAFAERFDGLVAGLASQGWALADAQQRALARARRHDDAAGGDARLQRCLAAPPRHVRLRHSRRLPAETARRGPGRRRPRRRPLTTRRRRSGPAPRAGIWQDAGFFDWPGWQVAWIQRFRHSSPPPRAATAPRPMQLFAALYDELHRMARRELAKRGAGVTLGATTLLHEAYLDISGARAARRSPIATASSATRRG